MITNLKFFLCLCSGPTMVPIDMKLLAVDVGKVPGIVTYCLVESLEDNNYCFCFYRQYLYYMVYMYVH